MTGKHKEKRNWFLSVLLRDIKLLYYTLSLGVIGALLGLAVSVFSQKLIDEIIPSHNINYLIIGLSIATGLIFLKIFVSYLQQYLGLAHSRNFNMSLIEKFFKRLLFLPKTFFDEHKTGGLIARMNDSASIQQTVSYVANTLVLNALILIVSSFVLFFYSVTAGVIALSSFPVYVTIAIIYKNKIAQKTHMQMDANAKKESNYISTIQNIDLVKTHNKQETFNKSNYNTYSEFQSKSFSLGKVGMSLGIMAEFIGTCFYIAILSYTSYQVLAGNLTIGEFSATIGIATGMLYPIGAIGLSILHLQGARVAFDRMYEFISQKKEFDEEEDDKKIELSQIETIEFKDVEFFYQEGVKLLKNCSFSVKKGEIACIFGKNGTGKSTILNLIMQLYFPSEGKIHFNGINSLELSINKLRNKVAIVSQQSTLFDLTVLQNICFDFDLTDPEHVIEYLNSMGFDKFISKLSEGYYTMVHENGKNLSGGQRQIISLARALYKKPDVLLVDEPTASLDGEAEAFVIECLKKFSKDRIVILVSHKLKPAKESSKIFILKDGYISDSGSHEELLLTDNLYAQRFAELVY